jgi:hypothetical protein
VDYEGACEVFRGTIPPQWQPAPPQ